ncbi:hypothetical protein GCG54_00014239, partial [Colletotrichum gloeosporioides]
NNFTCCLTLFSKCFSSFDHSTCALSVSDRYLVSNLPTWINYNGRNTE